MILKRLLPQALSSLRHDAALTASTLAHQQSQTVHFRPLIVNAHIQTILGSFGSARNKLFHSIPHFVRLTDGDMLYCDESRPPQWTPNCPTAILLHGLCGSTSSRYIVRLTQELFDQKIRAIGINMRGTGKGLPLAKKTYHAGLSDDLFDVLTYFNAMHPHSPTTVMGFSLGGNLALKMAGENREGLNKIVKKIIAICPPFDLDQVVQKLTKSKNRLYLRYFIKTMREQYCQWALYHGKEIPVFHKHSWYSFDDTHTAPTWGFADARDYYAKASCINFLPHIPTGPEDPEVMIFTSNDDPIVDNHSLKSIALPPSIKLLSSNYGGHMGFLGNPFSKEGVRWLDKYLVKQVYR